MRAETKEKHEMGKRFAIVIGVAAAGVMALGAQTGTAASEGVVEYKHDADDLQGRGGVARPGEVRGQESAGRGER